MKKNLSRAASALVILLALSLLLCSCKDANTGKDGKNPAVPQNPGAQTPSVPDTPEDPGENPGEDPGPEQDEEPAPTQPEPEDEYTYKEWPEEELTAWTGVVEHLFFHQIIAYPELAFDGDNQEKGFDDWMVTVSEFNKILGSLYEKGYILVNMNDVWSEYTDDSGNVRMRRNTLMIPKGKKPLIMSIDDTCYYESYIGNGFLEKLIIGEDGQIWAWGHDPEGNEVTTQDLDIVPALDKFVREHPDFSYKGTKACLSLTGYEGIFGYRTNCFSTGMTAEQEAFRASEIEAVKPIVEQLKKTGWYFGCHTWGHIRLDSEKRTVEGVAADLNRWQSDVGDIVGPTTLIFYPHGGRPDGDDWHKTGDIFKYLQGQGFRVFASVGTESFSYIKNDISAVICDRLHPDGLTLRYQRGKYLQFYDAKDIFDYDVRPDYGYKFD